MPKEIKIYNTLNRQKEVFQPITEGSVGIYSCGPTVYHFCHIGNMRSFVFADLLRRAFDFAGYDTHHVMNVTDVGHLVSDGDDGDDKMEVGKAREGLTAWGVAEKYTDAFLEHSAALNIKRPHTICKATDHIAEQIQMVKTLEEKGFTYIASDGVYFDTSKFETYGDMAKLDIEGLQSGIRIDDTDKKNKTDFALWKFSPKDEQRDMEWESPWGIGFPGWHIECSAMSMKYLGAHFDIHTGGIDHIPVHHTNEIAQSEACNGHKSVNYWMHNEFLTLDGDVKMSKSKGHILTVDTLIEKGYNPLDYRYYLMTGHYRKPMLFSYEAMDRAASARDKIVRQMAALNETAQIISEDQFGDAANIYLGKMSEAILDDLNTPQMVMALNQLFKDKALSDDEKRSLAIAYDTILDLGLTEAEAVKSNVPAEVHDLVAQRAQARADKNWAASDEIRDKIAALGYEVKDTADGVDIRKI